MGEAKPFDISKRDVWDAFKRVKANRGAAGVDGQLIADFEADLTKQPLQTLEPAVVRELFSTHRCAGSIFQKQMAGRVRWVSQRLPIVLPRKLSVAIWSLDFGAGCFTLTHMATGRVSRRLMPCVSVVSVAGDTTGVLDHRRQRLLRQHRLGAVAQGSPPSYGLSMGAALH